MLIPHCTWLSGFSLRNSVLSAVMLPPPLFIHVWSLSSTLHDSQWGSAGSVDPSRAPLWLVPLSPSSFSVLTRLIPHSLPVKGPKPWLLVAHANIPGWKMGQRARERERERETDRGRDRYSVDRQPPTDSESWVNKCPVYLGQGALTLAIRHACIKP